MSFLTIVKIKVFVIAISTRRGTLRSSITESGKAQIIGVQKKDVALYGLLRQCTMLLSLSFSWPTHGEEGSTELSLCWMYGDS